MNHWHGSQTKATKCLFIKRHCNRSTLNPMFCSCLSKVSFLLLVGSIVKWNQQPYIKGCAHVCWRFPFSVWVVWLATASSLVCRFVYDFWFSFQLDNNNLTFTMNKNLLGTIFDALCSWSKIKKDDDNNAPEEWPPPAPLPPLHGIRPLIFDKGIIVLYYMLMLFSYHFGQVWLPFLKGTQAKFWILGDAPFYMAVIVRLWYGHGMAMAPLWYDNPDV